MQALVPVLKSVCVLRAYAELRVRKVNRGMKHRRVGKGNDPTPRHHPVGHGPLKALKMEAGGKRKGVSESCELAQFLV